MIWNCKGLTKVVHQHSWVLVASFPGFTRALGFVAFLIGLNIVRMFWEQQQQYNKLKDKRRIRWHPLIVRFALNLKYLSSTAYKAVGSFLALPSQRTLQDYMYTHVMKFEAGTSDMISRMKADLGFGHSSPSQRKIALLMDEMKVKSGLVFNKSSGKLVGFVDLTSINKELKSLETLMRSDISHQPQQPPQLADQGYPSWTMPTTLGGRIRWSVR